MTRTNANYLVLLVITALPVFAAVQGASEIVVTAPKELNEIPEGHSFQTLPLENLSPGMRTLGQAFQSLEGTYVKQANPASEAEISLRGMSSQQVLILIDGVPVTRNSEAFQTLSLSNVERVVVSRGPLGATHGSGSMGGVVFVTTKQKVSRPKLKLSGGIPEAFSGEVEASQNLSSHRISLSASYDHRQGQYSVSNPWLGDTGPKTEIKNNQKDTANLGASLAWDRNTLPLSLSGKFGFEDKGMAGFLGQSFDSIREKSQLYGAKVSLYPLPLVGLTPSSSVSLGWDLKTSLYSDPKGERTGFAEEIQDRNQTVALDARPEVSLSPEIQVPIRITMTSQSVQTPQLEKSREAFFLGTGLRWSISPNLVLEPSVGSSFASAFIPVYQYGLGARYFLNKDLTFHTSVATGFRYPSLEDLYLVKGVFVGNPTLLPEKTLGGEVGVEWKTPRQRLALTYFLQRSENLIESVLVSGFQYRPFNFGEAISEGIEAAVDWRPADWVGFSFTSTFQNVLNKTEGDFYDLFVPGRPRAFGSTKVSLYPSETVTFAVGVVGAWERVVNRSNTQKLSDSFEMNAESRWDWDESTILSFEIRNFLNRNNFDIRGFPLPGVSVYGAISKTF